MSKREKIPVHKDKRPIAVKDKYLDTKTKYHYWAFKPRDMRLKRFLSQRQLAKLTGLTAVQISNYERGLMQPNASGIAKMATVLHCSPGALFERRKHPKPVKTTGPPECDEPGCESQKTLPQEYVISAGEAWLCGRHRMNGIIYEKLSAERQERLEKTGRFSPFKPRRKK